MTNPQKTLPMSVGNFGFLLDRLGMDCGPLQFLRELTQNAIEAGATEIAWDRDEHGKLCITDNGHGMTGPEMVRYINALSASGRDQFMQGNFGVGAKIAAATRNHAGLVYRSWKGGKGAIVWLWRDPKTGTYGLKQLDKGADEFGHWGELDEKPPKGGHGTRISLLGMEPKDDTMKAPPEATSASTWIPRYLNTRYFVLPKGVTLKARQAHDLMRTVTGQRPYLDAHKEASGSVELNGAVAHWWILKDEKAMNQNSGFVESTGHAAALWKNELYDYAVGRAGYARLQQFGIVFGYRQVVLYLEPRGKVETNTARTHLEPLHWADWAAEFREKMPAEIEELIRSIASRSKDDEHGRNIRERLRSMMDLYRVSRYRRSEHGKLLIAPPAPNAGGTGATLEPRPAATPSESREKGEAPPEGAGNLGNLYSQSLKKKGDPGEIAQPDPFPKVKWISAEEGTREPGDMEDRAARFIEDQNLLLVNGDFRVFADMRKHWIDAYRDRRVPGIEKLVRDFVHGWYEQALVETIIGLRALAGSQEWSIGDLDNAWSEAALSAVVMQRYHPFNAIKRDLAVKVASLK